MSDSPKPAWSVPESFPVAPGVAGRLYSLPKLEKAGVARISRLPVSIRIVLESLLRNVDGRRVRDRDVVELANWKPNGERTAEIPFVVARIVLQDFTGVPLLVDLAAMRSAVDRMGREPSVIEPLVPVALVVDHSIQVDYWSTADALQRNMEVEFKRNRARYEFLKWGMQAFHGFDVVPPGVGIVHQVNMERLAPGLVERDGVYFPDTLVGTDSHTTMINSMGVVGWGVGGIEAEAGMLGQPVYFLTPDVVGVHMTGRLAEGVTATDLALHVTEMLRAARVVGKFVEFHGEGAASLPVTERAPVANMAPEYGATMGFFPVDEETCRYLLATGRSPAAVDAFRSYFQAQGLFGIPRAGDIDYSELHQLDLGEVQPSVSGPRRPQDRIPLPALGQVFRDLLSKPASEGGYGKPADALSRRFPTEIGVEGTTPEKPLSGGGKQEPEPMPAKNDTNPATELEMVNNRPAPTRVEEVPEEHLPPAFVDLGHGDVLIAAITSCTNTSNPTLMLGAALLAKKAVERGLRVPPYVKASFAPGSRVVTDYLSRAGLQPYLDRLGFHLVGYGCTTCIGNSGPLDPRVEEAVTAHDLIAASVLSGNRNFEARIQQSIKANFLMSPPLVVAFALAGRVDIDLTKDPIGGNGGGKVYLRDIWPTSEEIRAAARGAIDADSYHRLYGRAAEENPLWNDIPAAGGTVYAWDADSTYIQEPPFFQNFAMTPGDVTNVKGARALAIFGDFVTTDHISPAGAIKKDSPAGRYLQERGVAPEDFNSYGSRRGNDRVMTRGTFANVRIRNLMVPGQEGGVTVYQPHGEALPIYDAAIKYQAAGVPLLVFAGQEYGSGSSRDWAAKGTRLLGVRAVVAQSFERIHRSNLVGMGVLPCQFFDGVSARSLGLDGTESFDLAGLEGGVRPRGEVTLTIHRVDGRVEEVPLRARIDTPIESDYYKHGGILPYVLRRLVA
ncbi:MAG TPA: aconitate hydratase [Thermoanaerobaculia bacterium]|nr:aconitate hydratase [Thermoanaerobaculia bacterium]